MAKYWMIIVIVVIPLRVFGAEPAGSSERRPDLEVELRIFDSLDIQTPNAVANTIEFLLCGQDPKHWLCGESNERRDEVASSIVSLSRIHHIPPFLLVVKFYLESRFDIHKVGKLGEIGISQVHGVATRGCELASAHGQMECGAIYLESLVNACKSKTLQSALLVYMSGKCRPGDKVWAIADYRLKFYFRLVKRAEDLFAKGLLPGLESLPEREQELVIVQEPTASQTESKDANTPALLQRAPKPTLNIRAIVATAREKAMRE